MKRTVFLICVSLCLYSCSPSTYRPLLTTRYDNIGDTVKYVHAINSKSPESDLYRIQPYDLLSVRNIIIDQITSTAGGGQSNNSNGQGTDGFRVESEGYVNLPTIGKVYVVGLTRKEAMEKIQGLYKTTLLKDPIIDVSIVSPRVTILGAIETQGSVPLLRENTSLVELIGQAGGLSTKADPSSIKIIRGDKANPEIIYVNLENLQSIGNPKAIMQNHDIVYVATDKKFVKYEKSQSKFSVFQSILVFVSTALIVYTSFFNK